MCMYPITAHNTQISIDQHGRDTLHDSVQYHNFTSAMDRSLSLKTIDQHVSLNCALDQMGTTDLFRIFHPTAAEYTVFCAVTFSQLGHRTATKQVSAQISEWGHAGCLPQPQHNPTRNKKSFRNHTHVWKLYNTHWNQLLWGACLYCRSETANKVNP